MTPNTIKAILQFTAIPVTDAAGVEYDALTQGAGAINAGGAVALAYSINQTAAIGRPWVVRSYQPYTTINGSVMSWGQKIVWGNSLVFGNLMAINEPAWAASTVWGNQPVLQVGATARNIVWGGNTVWDEVTTWAEKIVWGNMLIGHLEGSKIVWGYIHPDATAAQKIVWGYLEQFLNIGPTRSDAEMVF